MLEMVFRFCHLRLYAFHLIKYQEVMLIDFDQTKSMLFLNIQFELLKNV